MPPAIDMDEILSGHTLGGSRASTIKDVFPSSMTPKEIESAVRKAFGNIIEAIKVQGDRRLLRGSAGKNVIEFWYNTKTKVIETAYPKGFHGAGKGTQGRR